MLSEETLSQARQKTRKYQYKSLYSNTSYGFAYKKAASANCLSKYSQKEKPEQELPMFTK